MVHLVTGYAGFEHITSADQGSFNASFFGKGQFVMEAGKQMKAEIIDNHTVRVSDGDILMHGRHIRIPPDNYEEMTITTGTAGKNRVDLICMTYEKNTVDGTETAYMEVIKGIESEDSPQIPEYIVGDVLDGAEKNQMPLYSVTIAGVVLSEISCLFKTIPTYKTLAEKYEREFIQTCENHLGALGIIDTMNGIMSNDKSDQLTGALALKEYSVAVDEALNSKAGSNHTHDYLPLSGGIMNGPIQWFSDEVGHGALIGALQGSSGNQFCMAPDGWATTEALQSILYLGYLNGELQIRPRVDGAPWYLTGFRTKFNSGDNNNPTDWADVAVMESGEEHSSLWRKVSLFFKNVRYLWKLMGNTSLSGIGDGTVTGAVSALNSLLSGKASNGHTHDERYYTKAEVNALSNGAVHGGILEHWGIITENGQRFTSYVTGYYQVVSSNLVNLYFDVLLNEGYGNTSYTQHTHAFDEITLRAALGVSTLSWDNRQTTADCILGPTAIAEIQNADTKTILLAMNTVYSGCFSGYRANVDGRITRHYHSNGTVNMGGHIYTCGPNAPVLMRQGNIWRITIIGATYA